MYFVLNSTRLMFLNIFSDITSMKTIKYVIFALIEKKNISAMNLTIIDSNTKLNENQSCQKFRSKMNRRTFKTNFYINNQHHV